MLRVRRRASRLKIGDARRDPAHSHVLTPGRYVGAEVLEEDGEQFDEKMLRLAAQRREQQAEARRLDAAIEANLRTLDYAINE